MYKINKKVPILVSNEQPLVDGKGISNITKAEEDDVGHSITNVHEVIISRLKTKRNEWIEQQEELEAATVESQVNLIADNVEKLNDNQSLVRLAEHIDARFKTLEMYIQKIAEAQKISLN